MPSPSSSSCSASSSESPRGGLGRRCFDVHKHMLPETYLAGLAASGIDLAREDGFPTPHWSEGAALQFADQVGMGFSVISVSSPHVVQSDAGKGIELAQRVNDAMARLCAAHAERFGFAATLPLPMLAAPIDEAERAWGAQRSQREGADQCLWHLSRRSIPRPSDGGA